MADIQATGVLWTIVIVTAHRNNDKAVIMRLPGGKFYHVLQVKKDHKAVVDVREVSSRAVYVDDRRPWMVAANLRTRW